MRWGRFKLIALALLGLFSLQVSALPGHAAHHALHTVHGDVETHSICDLCHAYTFQNSIEITPDFTFGHFVAVGTIVSASSPIRVWSVREYAQARAPPYVSFFI